MIRCQLSRVNACLYLRAIAAFSATAIATSSPCRIPVVRTPAVVDIGASAIVVVRTSAVVVLRTPAISVLSRPVVSIFQSAVIVVLRTHVLAVLSLAALVLAQPSLDRTSCLRKAAPDNVAQPPADSTGKSFPIPPVKGLEAETGMLIWQDKPNINPPAKSQRICPPPARERLPIRMSKPIA